MFSSTVCCHLVSSKNCLLFNHGWWPKNKLDTTYQRAHLAKTNMHGSHDNDSHRHAELLQLCLTLCEPIDCPHRLSPARLLFRGIFQARVLAGQNIQSLLPLFWTLANYCWKMLFASYCFCHNSWSFIMFFHVQAKNITFKILKYQVQLHNSLLFSLIFKLLTFQQIPLFSN